MKSILTAAVLLSGITYASAQQGYPPECTSNYGYSAPCCKASYSKNPEGSMPSGQRHAQLAACTAKTKK